MISADGKVAGSLGHTDKPILQSRTADQSVKYGGHGMSTVSVLRDLVNRILQQAGDRIGTYLPGTRLSPSGSPVGTSLSCHPPVVIFY